MLGRRTVLAASCAAVFGIGIGLQIAGLGLNLDPDLGMWLALLGASSVGGLVATYRPIDSSRLAEHEDAVETAWSEFRRELRRSRRHGRPMTLVRFPAAIQGSAADAATDVEDLSTRARRIGLYLRLVDRTWVDGDSIFVLLPESTRHAAETLIARIRANAPNLVAEEPHIAAFPIDGLTSGALLAAIHGMEQEPVVVPLGASASAVLSPIVAEEAAIEQRVGAP